MDDSKTHKNFVIRKTVPFWATQKLHEVKQLIYLQIHLLGIEARKWQSSL